MMVGLSTAAEPVDPALIRHYVFTGQAPGSPVPDRALGAAYDARHRAAPGPGRSGQGVV
jgi:hypothetical protein